jgi:hypothetical protein
MKGKIIHELEEHMPFTAIATLSAVFITILLSTFFGLGYSENVFESFHVLHVIFSAFATTSVFYKHDKSIIKSIFVGVIGSILMGTISDVIFPYLGATALNLSPHFHLPIVQEPLLIIISALIGVFLGIIIGHTKMPHFFHVFLSVFASLFYVISFVGVSNIGSWVVAILITFISVLIPCCLSDIVFPMIFVKKKLK